MSNVRGAIDIAVGDETIPYRITMNGVCRFTENTGEEFMPAVQGMQDGADPVGFRKLFAVGLPSNASDLDRAGDVIDALGFVPAVELFASAVEKFIGQDDSPSDDPAPGKGKARPTKAT